MPLTEFTLRVFVNRSAERRARAAVPAALVAAVDAGAAADLDNGGVACERRA